MSRSTDPILKSMEVHLTDNEMSLLSQVKCPNCLSETMLSTYDEFADYDLKYFMKCASCLTDYTVYLTIKHATHIVTFKNGERIKCKKEISKTVQTQQNLKNTKDAKKDTPKKSKAKPE